MLTCLLVERLCAEHVPASERLEAVLGQMDAQRLVIPLAQRPTTRGHSNRQLYEPARAVAAA